MKSLLFILFLGLPQISHSYENVMLITIDTLRADYVGCYSSNKVKTPQIDSLAARGAIFQNAVSHMPLTLPSHVSLFTGLIPPAHGVRDNSGFYLSKKTFTLTQLLKKQGFKTAAFVGAFSLDSRFGLNSGFDLYDDGYPGGNTTRTTIPERRAEKVANAALEWLSQQGNGRWFVWIHFFDPHLPYSPPQQFKQRYPQDPYAGEVAYTDEQVGRILDFLKEKNLDSKTLVILTSDHGESLGEHGEKTHGIFAYESTLRVPLIVAPLEKTKQVFSRVRLIDVAPTVFDLLKVSNQENLQGNSLTPLFQGETAGDRESYFEAMTMNLNAGWAPLRGFYSGDFKFIDLPIPELYDLSKDPHETRNLCDDRDLCRQWQRRFSMLFPSNVSSPSAVDSETREQLAALGYLSGGSAPSANKIYTSQDDPKNLILLHDRAYQAVDLFNQNNYVEALEVLKKVIEQRPSYAEAYLIKSHIQSARGFPEDAVTTLKQAIQNGVSGAEIHGALGLYLQEGNHYEEAIHALNTAVKQDPRNPTYWNHLGIACDETGKPELALAAFQNAYDLDGSNATTLNNLGAFYMKREQFELAAEKFRAALEVNSNMDESYNGLGVAYENLNKQQEAFQTWQLALKVNPTNFDAVLHLGSAYLQRNENEKALELLKYFEKNAPAEKYGDILPNIRSLIQEIQN